MRTIKKPDNEILLNKQNVLNADDAGKKNTEQIWLSARKEGEGHLYSDEAGEVSGGLVGEGESNF